MSPVFPIMMSLKKNKNHQQANKPTTQKNSVKTISQSTKGEQLASYSSFCMVDKI